MLKHINTDTSKVWLSSGVHEKVCGVR